MTKNQRESRELARNENLSMRSGYLQMKTGPARHTNSTGPPLLNIMLSHTCRLLLLPQLIFGLITSSAAPKPCSHSPLPYQAWDTFGQKQSLRIAVITSNQRPFNVNSVKILVHVQSLQGEREWCHRTSLYIAYSTLRVCGDLSSFPI